MTGFSIFFVGLLVLTVITRLWLSFRQTNYVSAHRDRVPDPFSTSISLADHQKAADYTCARALPARIGIALDSLVLLAWTLGGGLAFLDITLSGSISNDLLAGAAVLISLFLISALVNLPISIWSTFGVEQRFGFNRTTVRTFVSDLLKGMMLLLLFGVPLALAALWFMRNSGSLWWLYLWIMWSVFTLFITWAWPAFIAPMFNKFEPLQDENLRQKIEALLNRCGFRSQGIFVMDGSKRSAHGNAYFTGLGNNKRIVFFDTLVETLSPDEIEAVLAHELGHFRLRHVRKRLVLGFIASFLILALLGWLAGQSWFYSGLGIDQPSNHTTLALFILVLPVFMYFLTPIGSWYSRRHEFEADIYATQHAQRDDMVGALVSLYRENASTLTPDPLHSAFYDSHPPAITRISHLQQVTEI